MRRLRIILVLGAFCLSGQSPTPSAEPPKPTPELERLNSLIDELSSLKMQVAQTETRIDKLLQALSEQRGALELKPNFNAFKQTVDADPGPADAKKPIIRCRALTSNGKRCTRGAMEGSKYCRQHTLAHQK